MKSLQQLIKNRRYVMAIFLAAFFALLFIVGVLLQNKIRMMFHSYVEQEVAAEIEMLAARLDARFGAELIGMENLVRIKGEDSWEHLLQSRKQGRDDGSPMGLLAQKGHAIVGEALAVTDWTGIRQSFQGHSAISYCKGKGLLLTVPIYSGENVRYVLYRRYTEEELEREFAIECFHGHGRALMFLPGGEVRLDADEWSEADAAYAERMEADGILRQLRGKLYTSMAAAMYDQEEDIVFMADISSMEGQIAGFVPASSLDGGLIAVMRLVIWVFALLTLLFVVGAAYLFDRERKSILAQESDRAKSAFLAHMSHEIRTPINAIMGMNEMILRETDSKDIRNYAQNAVSASRSLLSIINDILDISKIESRKLELVPVQYPLSELLNDVVNMVQIRAARKGLKLDVQVDSSLPAELYGDVTRVQQVMVNLLNNAVKYTQEGKVTFVLSACPPELCPLDVQQPGEAPIVLVVQVRDTGIGIRPEDMGKLFQDFVRLDAGKNRHIEGTGLGLALTHRFVHLMGGTIAVESIYGKGTLFTAWLPQSIRSGEPIGDFMEKHRAYLAAKTACRQEFTAPEARILVVDDNELNRLVAKNLMKRTEAQIFTLGSGAECLELLKQETFDLILMDDMMPVMGGKETLARIRHTHLADSTPVIALTANALVGSREHYMSLGFADYLSKPIIGSKLEDLLLLHLPREKLHFEEAGEPAEEAAPEQPSQAEQAVPAGPGAEQAEAPALPGAEEAASGQKPCLDKELGLKYVDNNAELYRTILHMFHSKQPAKQADLEKAYAEEDWGNYRILIHALKSTALTMGSRELSEAARALETAAKALANGQPPGGEQEEHLAYLHRHHAEVMSMYSATAEAAETLSRSL